jgi:hypothetical protein
MRRIATTNELQYELRQLLDYARSHQPSRLQLANELKELGLRVAAHIGMEHATPDALEKYLKEHPKADRSKHKVKGEKGDEASKSYEEKREDFLEKYPKDYGDRLRKLDDEGRRQNEEPGNARRKDQAERLDKVLTKDSHSTSNWFEDSTHEALDKLKKSTNPSHDALSALMALGKERERLKDRLEPSRNKRLRHLKELEQVVKSILNERD